MPKGKNLHAPEWAAFLELLIEVRTKADLTQASLAALMGASQPYVSQVEAGKIRLDTVQLRGWLHACGSDLGKFGRALERRLT